ncbi:MAG: hypothetical protein JRI31_10870 [Deltaproteobacteria bacterium]|nr:hypothetical protein [Deltaproteobacteria bacterium]
MESLFTFLAEEGVEPTNNLAERPFALEQGQKPELEWLTEAGNAQCHVITYR